LDRDEAINLLKEMGALGLIAPSMVTLEKNTSGRFSLVFKDHCDSKAMEQFATKKHLAIKINSLNGFMQNLQTIENSSVKTIKTAKIKF